MPEFKKQDKKEKIDVTLHQRMLKIKILNEFKRPGSIIKRNPQNVSKVIKNMKLKKKNTLGKHHIYLPCCYFSLTA